MNAPNVLIVDDEALVRWSLKERFSREGYTDPRTVETALERLVASSFLSHAGAFYVRADVGRHRH